MKVNDVDVSIIIVNYNTQRYIESCLASIYNLTSGVSFEVIVVDNNSEDESVKSIKTKFNQVKLILNENNLGFGAANNLAVGLAQGRHLFFLNPDTVLLNNAVKMFFDYYNSHSNQRIGALGAWLQDADGKSSPSYGDFASLKRLGYTVNTIRYLTPRVRAAHDQYSQGKPNDANAAKEVDYVTGADLFVPKDVLKDAGIFDPRFFMFFEEMDLQYRMHKKKYKRLIINGPRIIHHFGKSFTNNAERSEMMLISDLKFFKKHTYCKYHVYKFVHLADCLITLIAGIGNKDKVKRRWSYLKNIVNESDAKKC